MSLNDDLLNEDPDSLAIEADDLDLLFEPDPNEESSVVSIEPDIISIKRGERKRALRDLPEEQK